jgi:hypothetical protein
MCDALTVAIISGVSALASAGVSYAGEQSTMNAQNKANDDWVAYQQNAARTAAATDDKLRQQADAARQGTLQQLTPQAQQQTAATDTSNLTSQMLAGNPAGDQNVQLLSGQDKNTDPGVTADIAGQVTTAARQARGRIAAMAGLSGYGTGYGGMQDTANRAIMQGNQAIALPSDERAGNTATLGIAQNVPVKQYTSGANLAGSLATGLAGIAGNAFAASKKGVA